MIEDINERMTQFAPSQNNPLNDDPIADKIVMARKVTQQPDAATIDVDPIADRIVQNRRDLMMATFGSAADANPDQAAQAKKLGEQFGVGADIAGRNMQQLKKQALLDELDRRDLMRRDPILARYLSNHDFAAMAHDDIDNLSKVGPLFQGSWFARYEDPIAYGKKTISMIDERFRRGRAIVEMGRANDLLGLRAQWSPDPRKASEISEELKKLTTEGGIVGAGVEVVGQMLEGIPEVAETTAMGATAGGAVGSVGGPAGFLTIPAGMLTGAGAGFAAGSARSAFMAESGNSYQQMIEQGYDPEVARKAAIGVGVVNASIEMISFGALGPVLRRLGVNVFRPAVANALAKPTAAKALATLGSDYAKAVAAGASEEFLQEIATGIGDDIARVYGSSSPSRILDEGGITDLLGTALESGVQGAMGMAILGGVGPVANFRYDMRRAGAAERQQAFFERLSSIVVDIKLRFRDLNELERFIASQAEGTDAETIFVDAAAMQGVLRQSNLSDEQIDEALPGVREQLPKALQDQGDVTFPTASFAARIAGTDLANSMLPHVRLAPGAMSLKEAQEFQKNRDQLVEQARVIMEEKGRADDAFVQESRQIYDRIRSQAIEAGQEPDVADVAALLYQAFIVTRAADEKTTPAQIEARRRRPLTIEQVVEIPSDGVAITEQLEQASRRAYPSLAKAWDRYNSGERYMTVGDLADKIESLDLAGKRIPQSVLDAVQNFRNAQREEREMYGERGGTEDDAGNALEIAVQNAAEQMREEELPPNIMQQAATMDAEYLAAVERGDMETAQQQTDATAERSFPESVVRGDGDIGTAGKILRVYHGSGAFIRQFMYEFTGQGVDQLGSGFYFTTDRPEAESYMTRRRDGETVKIGGESQPTVVEAYLDIRNPLRADKVGSITREKVRKFIAAAPEETRREGLENWGIDGNVPSAKVLDAYAFKDANIVRELFKIGNDFYGRNTEAFNRAIKEILGYDGVVQDFRSDGVKKLHYVAFFPEQIKSADPVTRDEAGNIIPLSRRFDITSPRIFEQAAPGQARGGFDPSRLAIMLTRATDRTTMWHELVHFFLQTYTEMIQDGSATQQVRDDMDLLLQWFKIEGDTPDARFARWAAMSLEQQRKHHEALTYNAEIYAFEGKAPSVELVPVFERLRAFMLRAYKSIRDDLNAIYRREFGEDLPILTGEVRQVMDRMLASEEQIKRQAAINEMKPMFQTQEQSGMDDAEWAAYQQMQQEAVEAAVTDMNKASLRQMQWLSNARSRILRDLQAKHAKQRKEIREEVAEEIRRQPLYRAMEYLRTGTFTDADGEAVKMEGAHRLDMESVRQMYEREPENLRPDIAKLGTGGRGMMGMNGIDPDVAAELFGFSSGDELIRALIEAQPMKEAIDARTDEVMLERFSELSTPEGREAKVQESLHNEARARFVAVELRFVAKATQPARVLMEAARQAAREMIAGKRIADLRPSEFIAAEARAARSAAKIGKPVNVDTVAQAAYTRAKNEALASGAPEDVAEAGAVVARDAARAAAQARLDEQRAQYGADPAQALIRAKRAQLYQNQLAAEALAARDEVEKGVRYLRQVMRDSNVKRMGADVADQIDRILERFNLRPMSAKRMAERQSLVQWLESLKESGLEPDLAPEILDEAARKPYREMTVAEFRDLVDAVKQLEYIGKNAQKIKRAQEMAEFEEVRDEIVASVRGNFTGKETKPRSPTTAMGKRIAKAKRFLYSHLKAAAIARIMDGGQDDGPVWNFLIRTANDAGDMETRMRAEATKRLTEILAPVFALGKMGGKGIYFDTVGMSLNREARLVIALNMGNDGNRQRLLDGEGWTLEQVQPILESLTEAEWKAVQDVWDYMESFRPLVGAKERRLYGREPKWVTPVPFTVRTADGKEARLSGGYYPIKYDPIATERAETADEAEKARAELRGAYTAATTRRSFTKARAAKVEDRPLLYTMTGVYSGINDVIHDIAWHEWLIQANRLMRDEKFDRAVRETYGAEFKSQLKGWIKDVAAGERGSEDAADMFASYIRRSVSAAGLGFNIVSAILQVTGFSQSIVRVGAKHVARGVAAMAASPLQTMKFVNEKSSFMQERARTQFRELNELRNMVGDESAAQRRLRLGTYFLMMRMQRMVDVPTWVGAYEKALEAGKDDATAVALADQAVIDSQGGGMLKDLSKIERGGALSKLFTVFYSYMNTVYNMAAVSTMTPRSKGRLAADYAMLFIVPVVLNYALKKALTPDVDDEEPDMEKIATDLVAEELAFLMGTMVGVREFQNAANAVVGKETAARGYEGPAGLRAIGEAGRFAVQAKQLEFDRAFRRSAINMLGIGLGLPSAQINRTIDGIEALAEGETENPFAVLTGVQR